MKGIRGITPRQFNAVEFWFRDGRKSMAGALRKAGYSEAIARQPHKVFGSSVVIRELALRGFDEYGRRRALEIATLDRVELESRVTLIDFSKMSKEQLQELKALLGDISHRPREEETNSHDHALIGNAGDLFDSGSYSNSQNAPSHPSFSSF